MGERTPLALLDAPASGRMAIGEAVTNIASSAISKISDIKLSANWMVAAGYESEDHKLFATVEAVAKELCPQLGICIPVGKDSMSMRTVWQQDGAEHSNTAPLSLIISAFAPVVDVRATTTPELRKNAGANLYLLDLGCTRNRLGGSALTQVFNKSGGQAPDLDKPELLIAFFQLIQQCRSEGLLAAYHDRSDGGLLTTLLEMAFVSHCGLQIELGTELGEDPIAALFTEELGAVIQVEDAHLAKVQKLVSEKGLAAYFHLVASIRPDNQVIISRAGETLVHSDRTELQRIWAATSFHMQSIRDNSDCARQEYDQLLDENDPGMSVTLAFDVDENIAAPYVNVNKQPRVAVLREQGVNGQVEMAAAFTRAHFDAVDVHMTDLIEGRVMLDGFNVVVACGGFSYGDVLGAGGGWAKSILYNAELRRSFEKFFHNPSTLTLGVCNGCQMVSLLQDLIPGAENWPRFVRNQSEQFEGRVSLVSVTDSPSAFLHDMQGSRFPIAVAHGEGKAEFLSSDAKQKLQDTNGVILNYVDNYGQVTEAYPANPNGSPAGIAGVCSADGRATIMMPHPERVFRASQNSWHPAEWQEDAPSMRLFRNARRWLD